MKAIVYTGPNTVEVLERSKPTIQDPTDVVVRLLHASICGTVQISIFSREMCQVSNLVGYLAMKEWGLWKTSALQCRVFRLETVC
jgi:cytochrome b